MLRRLDVRTRLVTVIVVPIVLLLAVALPELLDRQQRAEAADVAGELATSAEDLAATAEVIQAERTATAVQVAGGTLPDGSPTVAELRAATDAAAPRAAGALRTIARLDGGLTALAQEALEALSSIDEVRAMLDAKVAVVPWEDPYAPIVDALLAIEDRLGASATEREAGSELAHAALLGRAREAAAAQDASAAAAVVWGDLRGDQLDDLERLRADEEVYARAFAAAAPSAERGTRDALLVSLDVATAGRVVDSVTATETVEPAGDLASWLAVASDRQSSLRAAEAELLASADAQASALGSDARQDRTIYALLAGTGLLLAIGIALVAARTITRPLRRLTEAADELAGERLPQLVDALLHPGADDERHLAATVESLEVTSDDELGRLAASFNAVQRVAVEVAAQQATLLRKGIGDLYVNLARRNQSLIERQIQLLDQLEAEEEDPDVLEHLYSLDHLATRMRRNAESLLVLAGAEQGQRRPRPAELVDVVRAAVSEVEDYERVRLGSLANAVVTGAAASDLAHIIAELLENATRFSPPDTPVDVVGSRTGSSYQLVIRDMGIGMTPAQLEELNTVLREPPVTGLALGRSLGCLVAARLAARHGIGVRLRAGTSGGTAAYVVLPHHLVDEPGPTASSPMLSAPARSAPSAPRPTGERLRDVLPSAASLDADLDDLLGGRSRPALVEPPVASPSGSASATDPVATGLPRRPAHLPAAATSADGSRPAPLAANGPAPLARRTPGASGAATMGAAEAETRSRRSPDEVRSMLSQYRSGLRAGRGSDRPSPAATTSEQSPEPVPAPDPGRRPEERT